MKIMVKINDWIIYFEYFADFLVPLLLYTNKKNHLCSKDNFLYLFCNFCFSLFYRTHLGDDAKYKN